MIPSNHWVLMRVLIREQRPLARLLPATAQRVTVPLPPPPLTTSLLEDRWTPFLPTWTAPLLVAMIPSLRTLSLCPPPTRGNKNVLFVTSLTFASKVKKRILFRLIDPYILNQLRLTCFLRSQQNHRQTKRRRCSHCEALGFCRPCHPIVGLSCHC